MSYEEQLCTLGLSSSLEKRRLRGVLTALYFWGGEAEGELPVSSLKYPMTELMSKAQSCAREDLNWMQRNISIPQRWSNIGTSFLSKPRAYHSLRGIWTVPSTTSFNFWLALNCSGSWTRWLLQVPSNWKSLFFLILYCSVLILVKLTCIWVGFSLFCFCKCS